MINENLNNLESQILRILENHRGKSNAIGRFVLVDQINAECPLFPVHERKMRETIAHLRAQHGERIGSWCRGYFLTESAKELEGVCKYFRSYAMSLLFSESRLRNQNMAELLGQIRMEFEAQK